MITRVELKPVMLIPISLFMKKILSVTTTMDSANEKVTLSMMFIRLKKTRVQANPGRKNTNREPSIALMTGKRSRRGKTDSKSSLIGDSQSMLYFPLFSNI